MVFDRLNTLAQKPARRRARRAASGRLTRLVAAVTALTLLAVLAVGTAVSVASQGIEVQVEQCPDGKPPPPGQKCPTQTTTVQQQNQSAPTRQQSSSSAPAQQQHTSKEVHDYNLKSGKGTVKTAEGNQTADTLNLNSTPTAAPLDPTKKKKPTNGGVPANSTPTQSTVSTSGGSTPSSGSSPFDFVNGDSALNQFAVPPFLVPIYVSAGRAYGIPWNVLASINQIETDFGRLGACAVSSAGAAGWMQFMPGTWKTYGVDASGDGFADPCNPVDAIYAAARYLRASGGDKDIRKAIFSYNHAGWYVDRVLKTASIYGSLPDGIVAETGSMAFGRFPVRGKVSYGDDFRKAQAAKQTPEGLNIVAQTNKTSAVATQNVKVTQVLLDSQMARAFRRQGQLRRRGVARPKVTVGQATTSAVRATVAVQSISAPILPLLGQAAPKVAGITGLAARSALGSKAVSALLFKTVVRNVGAVVARDGMPPGYAVSRHAGLGVVVTDAVGNHYSYSGLGKLAPGIRPGQKLRGGQLIGALPPKRDATVLFGIRGSGGQLVDPRPLVDGYRLQEAANYYNAVKPLGGNPFLPDPARHAGSITGGNQTDLERRVLSDPGIVIYPGGRGDIEHHIIDKRVLGALLYLRANGLKLYISCLRNGHSFYTAAGGISAHSFGAAVDIAGFNGQAVTGHQGPGSLTEQAIKLLMKLKGAAQPRQLISLMSLGGPSFAMADHYNHLHVGYSFDPSLGVGRQDKGLGSVTFTSGGGGGSTSGNEISKGKVSKKSESALSSRIGRIKNPGVNSKRSGSSVEVESKTRRAQAAAQKLAASNRSPLQIDPSAAGARLVDVDIPDGARGDEAYAVGTVAGNGRAGWAKQQTVILAHRDGTWKVVGPPRDAQGRIANPNLSSIAATVGGRGYAVGDHGQVVALRGSGAPLLLDSGSKARLTGVAARGSRGYAVGERGTVLSLSGSKVSHERLGGGLGGADLQAVTFRGDRAFAAGSQSKGDSVAPVLVEGGNGSWSASGQDFRLPPGRTARLTAVSGGGGQLWVAGAARDAGSSQNATEVPFAARLDGNGWTTFCAGPPELAAVSELGKPSPEGCDQGLVLDQSRGAAGDVIPTAKGVVVSTSNGLQINKGRSFAPAGSIDNGGNLGLPGNAAKLALSQAVRGFAVAAGGQLVSVAPSGPTKLTGAQLPLPLRGVQQQPVALAAPSSGHDLLALSGGSAAVFNGKRWQGGGGPGLPTRDTAYASPDHPWAILESGQLMTNSGGGWQVPGEKLAQRATREALAGALAGQSLQSRPGGHATGLTSLAFSSSDQGYAVGAGGGIVQISGEDLSPMQSPTSQDLRDVAAAKGNVVAVGDKGTLLELDGDSWKPNDGAAKLAAGADFTSVDVLPDGTVLAAAGGTLLQRSDKGNFEPAPLQPLGLPALKLTGYRTDAGELRAIVLAQSGDHRVVLEGDRQGWRPVDAGAGLDANDFAYSRSSKELWVAGEQNGQPVAAHVSVAGGSAPAKTERSAAAPKAFKPSHRIAARNKSKKRSRKA
jgi:transglycosylase-like protein with SLT domain